MPRLIYVAGDFTKYDEYAVKQINRNIDLIRYKRFGNDLLLLELINSSTAKPSESKLIDKADKKASVDKTFQEQYDSTSSSLRTLYDSIRDYIMALGDDITENQLKYYTAFKKIRNIICAEIYQKQILLHLRLNPDEIQLEEGFTRDMRQTGHFGTGDLQVIIKEEDDFVKAKNLIDLAYHNN
jgi:predicted transport protein